MNKITFPRIGADGILRTKEDIESWYKEQVYSKIQKRLNQIRTPQNLIEQNCLNIVKRFLKNILVLPPSAISSFCNIIDKKYPNLFVQINNSKEAQTTFAKIILSAFNYSYYRETVLVDLAKFLNVKSCPYCNMQFTLYGEKGTKKKDKFAKLQFDHFFSKIKYPLFSMSLYNLIPSCSVCNQGKSSKKLSLAFHPYYDDIHTKFHFEIKYPLPYYLGIPQKDFIDLKLVPDNSTNINELNTYLETFNIKELYSRHGDIAKEVFDKAYLDKYYRVSDNFRFLGHFSSSYANRLIMGTYDDVDDIEKRPMTKFIQDLWKQAKK